MGDAARADRLQTVFSRYRGDGSDLIPVLQDVQEVLGYIPADAIAATASFLSIPESTVYGVATFYSLFSLKPKGRHTIKVCLGTACYVKGIKEVLNRITAEYGVKEGETSADRRFSLEAVRCLGACGLAPVVVVGEDVHGIVTSEKVAGLLKNYD